jgi:integrase
LPKDGVHPKILSEKRGHINIGITFGTYNHILPELQERMVAGDPTLVNMGR